MYFLTLFDVDAFDPQEFSEARDLFFELADQFGVGVFVDNGFADDLFGSISVPFIEIE